ncbi:MAG: xanthine dehydrogenase family protein, partial [Thermoplasmata archaeon]
MSVAVRPDARAKAAGAVPYGMDLTRPGMLFGALVLAPPPRGRLRSVDLSGATARPGVVAIAAGDLPSLRGDGPTDAERPIFPREGEEIAYPYQPLAAVAAPTLAEARDAAAAVRVRIDPAAPVARPTGEGPAGETIAHVHARHGDVEAAFASADLVLTETYTTAGVLQVALEPHAAIGEVDEASGRWTVRTSTQSPFGVREDLAAALGVPEERIVVHATWVGGGFGGKGSVLLEPYALLLARAAGRPVRLALTYREEFLLGRSTLPTFVRIASSVRGGAITGRRILWRLDAGASLPGRDFAAGYGIGFLAGPYRVPAIELEGYAIRTGKPPLGPHRAPLAPQGAFVAESHMDHLAERLGEDSAAFRERHAWREGDRTHLGQPVGPFGLAECFARARALADRWRRDRGPSEGIGIGAGFWSTGT